ncbi:MAG: hypothetical protein AAF333_08645 [Planctomycetota bacterium]
MPRPQPPAEELTEQDIAELWENAADPDDYPALRIHRVTQEGEPAGLPDDVVELARATADRLTRRRRRRRRSGEKPKPSTPPGEVTGEAIHELMEMLDVPEEAYDVGRYTVALHVDDDEAAGYPPLPEGYGFKGGVSRKALARTLRLPVSTAAVRDIDLLRGPDVPDDHDRELAERYMTEDLILGNAKVEALVTPRDYFATREVTMNQLYFLDGEIQVTPLGLLDTLGGVIRVTQGHLNLNRGKTHPIVAFKALRFAANLRAEGREPVIRHFRTDFRRRPHPFAFFLALQLSRAYESGPDTAAFYLDYAREWGLLDKADLPEDITAAEAAAALKQRLTDYHLNFTEA